ncbi:hypothetical protein HYW19_00130 [Candidatus Woesearchaeota archaeon]|nr:hypothetical protein [Candidatus Woesearchaeota archaeon]
MQGTYDYLANEGGFLDIGKRPHNPYSGLPMHLWDTAYRAWAMGLDLETRQIALMHSLLEYKARGLEEARKMFRNLEQVFSKNVVEGIEALTFWDAILLDHLQHTTRRIGIGARAESYNYEKILARISKNSERHNVAAAIQDAANLKLDSKKRIIPLELTDGDPIYKEARAMLHRMYAERVYQISREILESRYGSGQAYDNRILTIEALCIIDKLRTVDGRSEVERVTREAFDFLPHLDAMQSLLRNSDIFNNPLALAIAALKTELLIELDQRASEAKNRRDTTFAVYADLLGERLLAAGRLYGDVAGQMGYTPRYTSPKL